MTRVSLSLRKIVSGGQTGVDRGALDAAIALGMEHGGWCPRGRRAEDGRIPRKYRLQTTDSADYKVRTQANVLDSDGTLILCRGPLRGGTQLTHRLATAHDKACLVIDLNSCGKSAASAARLRRWLANHHIAVLNVAGPRESLQPDIAAETKQFLTSALSKPA